jgi:hypothetical protein
MTVRFAKGNKLAKGGRRNPPGGRPTREQMRDKKTFQEAVEREIAKRINHIACHYVSRALKNDRVLMHLIDKVMSDAKTELNVTGGIKVVEITAPDPDKE